MRDFSVLGCLSQAPGLTAESRLTCDSRQIRPGDVFAAARGQCQDGRKYIDSAAAAGAAAVIYENDDGFAWHNANVPSLGVAHLSDRLPELADGFYGRPSSRLGIIGITGTNGKSSTAFYIAQLLSGAGIPCGIVGTVGNGFPDHLEPSPNTTPGPVEIQQELLRQEGMGARWVAMEVSSHGIAQGRINGLRFRGTVFTNVSRDHLDFHKTFEAYFDVKKGFVLGQREHPCVLNAADPLIRSRVIPEVAPENRVTVGPEGDYAVSDIRPSGSGTSFRLASGGTSRVLTVPLIGAFNVYNALQAFAAVRHCTGTELDPGALETLRPLKGRMEIFRTGNSPLCLVDYAHTPDGLEKALTAARAHTEGKLISVVGCGGDRDRGKRPMMAEIASSLSDQVYFTDDNPRTEDPEQIIQDMLRGRITCGNEVIHDRAAAIRKAVDSAGPQDTVLVAGKGHEEYQIVGTEKRHYSDQETLRGILGL